MKRTIFNGALVLAFVGTVLPAIAKSNTSASVLPSIYAQNTAVNGTLVEPRRIRLPKVATQRSTKSNPNCLCPYDIAFKGSICGERSAYVKLDGDEPACYEGETAARQLWWNNPNNQFVDRNRQGQ
ncbi:hypothetical protein [Nostoc sp. UHCC 0252]|uniref:hypothetical protein n=1 Tax=Nostoc sp. UHCC 0252 TaxID=3110241 RepID=UPI002B21C585|nr:hypothetical protein [Nostoc sp. UHCC 0252]MEA5601087.1 hypothetical protein [Nostoc sp. UHCC 0252]